MRYESWDVILFPTNCHVPIQEFKTACYASQDELGHILPTLTCYVASLPALTPFRISVHSWTKPIPSALIERKQKPEQRIVYKIRIFMDGFGVFHDYYETSHTWPQEIKHEKQWKNRLDTPPTHQAPTLRFPQFRDDILAQSAWDVREDTGRIKVIISEQLLSQPSQNSLLFGASNDLICFSFQYAPEDVLERANISWPLRNPLYGIARGSFPGRLQGSARKRRHSPRMPLHSPRSKQQQNSNVSRDRDLEESAKVKIEPFPKFEAFPNPPRSSLHDPFADPFDDASMDTSIDASWEPHHTSISGTDVSMQDCLLASPPSRPRNVRRPYDDARQVVMTLRDDQFGRLIEALSPPTHYCFNQTPQSQPPPHIGGIPFMTKPSAAALARTASYPNLSAGNVKGIFKYPVQYPNGNRSSFFGTSLENGRGVRPSQAQTRYSTWESDISSKSPASVTPIVTRVEKNANVSVSSPATGVIKSRKEGKGLSGGNQVRPALGHHRAAQNSSMDRLERDLLEAINDELSGCGGRDQDARGKRKREGMPETEVTPENKISKSGGIVGETTRSVVHEISDD